MAFSKTEIKTRGNVLKEVRVDTELSEDQRKELENLLLKHHDIFSKDETVMECVTE